MTAYGTSNSQQPAGDGRSDKTSQKRRFREAWKEAFTRARETRKRQHFAETDCSAFNDLLAFFGGNYFKVIVRENCDGAEWTTRRHATPPRNLQALYQDENLIVGMRFNTLTRVLILDLDRNSPYHPCNNEPEYRRLLAILEDIGLVGVEVVQSSFSEGIHLYIPFPKPIPSWLAAHALYVVLSKAGFRIAKGQLEVFPNRKGFGTETIVNYNGIRLPLQPNTGSYALDPVDFSPLHSDLSTFAAHLKHHARRQDMTTFKRVMKGAYEDFRVGQDGRIKGRHGSAAAWHDDLLVRILQGWTGDAQTNDLVFEAVKHAYVFQHQDGEELVSKTAAWLRSLPGYDLYCGHKHNLEQRVRDWLKSTKNLGYYPYTGEYRPRHGVNYGGVVAATVAGDHQDGRSHNKANVAKRQAARNKLAEITKIIRHAIRQGEVTAPQTRTGLLNLVIATAKQHLGEGFSLQFLYRFKSLLEKLKGYAVRVASVVKPPAEPTPEAEPTRAENTSSETPNPRETEVLLAFLPKVTETGTAEPQENKGVTGFLANNEGGGGYPFTSEPTAFVRTLRVQAIELWREVGTVLKYTGKSVTGLVETFSNRNYSDLKQQKCELLETDCLVQLTDEIHSMEERHGLVYVKPVHQPWCGGIAVKVDFLLPEPS